MIDKTKLDALKRILDRKGQHAYGVAFDVAGIAEDEDVFDLDLLRDLVALAEATTNVDPMELAKDAHKWGFEQGWEACADSIGGPRGLNAAWISYKSTL